MHLRHTFPGILIAKHMHLRHTFPGILITEYIDLRLLFHFIIILSVDSCKYRLRAFGFSLKAKSTLTALTRNRHNPDLSLLMHCKDLSVS